MASQMSILYRTRSLLTKPNFTIKSISTFPYLNQEPELVDPTPPPPTESSLPPNPASGSPLYNENWRNPVPKTSSLTQFGHFTRASVSETYDSNALLNVFGDWVASQRWGDVKEMFEGWVRSLDKNGKPNKPDVNLFNHYIRANLMIGASAADLLDLLAQMEEFDILPNTASFNLVLKAMHQSKSNSRFVLKSKTLNPQIGHARSSFQSMGMTTSNRKRSEECMSVLTNHTTISISQPSSKRPKFSYQSTRPVSTSNAIVSRLSRYPDTKPQFLREVHAPCRPRKFNLSRKLSNFGDFIDMGNFLQRNYEKVKRSALGKCRLVTQKEKVVIDLDSDGEDSDDSGVVEVVEIRDTEMKDVEIGVQRRLTDSALTNAVVNVEDHDLSSVHVYKKLLQGVQRRTDTIQNLNFQIELNEKRRDIFQLLRPKKELIEEVPFEPFVPLTDDEENEVSCAFSSNRRKVLVAHESSNIEVSGEKMRCLLPGAWLNDEVINLYLELLKERERREPKKFLKCHFFSTFFYKKLISGRDRYDYKSVRRWTTQRKLGYSLFDCDKIFVPIHKEIHWCLAVINKRDAKFQYLDSLKGMDRRVLEVLARYYVDEVKDKTGKDIDVSTWEKEYVEDLPEQENGFDCGVFMIKYADFYSRGLGLCFNQEHMPYFRRRTAKEVLRLRAD